MPAGGRAASPHLTCCGLFNTPPERAAAALAPLRPLGAEVVLAVDDRVDPAWVDGYRQIADRVFCVPFPGRPSRLYAWLREQCSGRWILQLDADEVPGAGLAGEIEEAFEREDEITHCWLPRRWLYPDQGHWLAQHPWRPDYSLRLMRNDPALVRFPALLHLPIEVEGPALYLREPLYHADLLLATLPERERKVELYESARPGYAVIDGRPFNEAFYLPERRSGLRCLPVPAGDCPAVREFVTASCPVDSANGRAPLVQPTLAEVTQLDECRTLPDEAYRARLRLLEDDLRLIAGETRTFDVEVENLGSETWPGGMRASPQIRLAYRWLDADGSVAAEGLRTPIPAPLRPRGRAIVPLVVNGGPGTAEIDLVHEGERWFGCGIQAAFEEA